MSGRELAWLKWIILLFIVGAMVMCGYVADKEYETSRERKLAEIQRKNKTAEGLKAKGTDIGKSLGLSGIGCRHMYNIPRIGGGVRCSGLKGDVLVDIVCTYDGSCVLDSPNIISVSASAKASVL